MLAAVNFFFYIIIILQYYENVNVKIIILST